VRFTGAAQGLAGARGLVNGLYFVRRNGCSIFLTLLFTVTFAFDSFMLLRLSLTSPLSSSPSPCSTLWLRLRRPMPRLPRVRSPDTADRASFLPLPPSGAENHTKILAGLGWLAPPLRHRTGNLRLNSTQKASVLFVCDRLAPRTLRRR
jgi:hypothetical protein